MTDSLSYDRRARARDKAAKAVYDSRVDWSWPSSAHRLRLSLLSALSARGRPPTGRPRQDGYIKLEISILTS